MRSSRRRLTSSCSFTSASSLLGHTASSFNTTSPTASWGRHPAAFKSQKISAGSMPRASSPTVLLMNAMRIRQSRRGISSALQSQSAAGNNVAETAVRSLAMRLQTACHQFREAAAMTCKQRPGVTRSSKRLAAMSGNSGRRVGRVNGCAVEANADELPSASTASSARVGSSSPNASSPVQLGGSTSRLEFVPRTAAMRSSCATISATANSVQLGACASSSHLPAKRLL
mmetsp:Transcript_86985/g.243865  ORF Transcript_86985/g.243865 Transcript_86985/m.243865 type:complete len:229 (-) Transcript_86985:337-1023(-)